MTGLRILHDRKPNLDRSPLMCIAKAEATGARAGQAARLFSVLDEKRLVPSATTASFFQAPSIRKNK